MPRPYDTRHYDEQLLRDLADRLLLSTDRREQDRLKAELVTVLLQGQPGRQQHAMRELIRQQC
jgi:hypothetical protein